MCHALLEDASFWAFIHQLDIDIAAQVQRQGCPHCGGKLHSACYPRKPRGVCRHVLRAITAPCLYNLSSMRVTPELKGITSVRRKFMCYSFAWKRYVTMASWPSST